MDSKGTDTSKKETSANLAMNNTSVNNNPSQTQLAENSLPAVDDIPYESSSGEIYSEPASEPMSADAELKYKIRQHEEESNDTNKKVAKTVVKGVAGYFGGPAGIAAADAINNSGVLDPVYDKIAQATTDMADANPMLGQVQKGLNQANKDGTLDAADAAVSALGGGSGGAGAASAGAGASAASGASSAATNAAGTAANGANAAANGANAAQSGSSAAGKFSAEQIGDAALDGASAYADKQAENAESEQADEEENEDQNVQSTSSPPAQSQPKKESKSSSGGLTKLLFPGFNWKIMLICGGGLFFILFIILLIMLLGGGGASEQNGYLDPKYDFTDTQVFLTDSSGSILIDEMSFEDLIVGATYIEFYDDMLEGYSNEAKKEVFKAFMVDIKTTVLSLGGYDSTSKEIYIKSGIDGIPYCDPSLGCKIYDNNGKTTYYPAGYTGQMEGSLKAEIPAADGNLTNLITSAYRDTEYLLLVPNSVNSTFESITFNVPPYNQTIKADWISKASSNTTYQTLITNNSSFNGYKIYNLQDYVMQYNYSTNIGYWWPIGSSSPDSAGLYSGSPTATAVTSEFGYRTHPVTGVQNSFHGGVDIGASCGQNIIATRDGTVVSASYSSGYGNNILIDHGSGIKTRYAHIQNGGLKVKAGDSVKQGQLIGLVGTTGMSTGCHLHFEIEQNDKKIDPLGHISASNPRPVSTIQRAGNVSGANNTQVVCLTLKQMGFSDNATAALMTNIHHESTFRTDIPGDNGTSYGLCQWHNGRYTNLRNFCGNRLNEVSCQLDFLAYELTNSYKGVYNYLTSQTNSAWDMANYFCLEFERPANKQTRCPDRANSNSQSYLRYVQNNCS